MIHTWTFRIMRLHTCIIIGPSCYMSSCCDFFRRASSVNVIARARYTYYFCFAFLALCDIGCEGAMAHGVMRARTYVYTNKNGAWLIALYTCTVYTMMRVSIISHVCIYHSHVQAAVGTTCSPFWSLILCTIVIVPSSTVSPPLSVSQQSVVFHRGEGGYYCIKIPTLLTTAKGTLVAFGEGRMFSCSDFTWTDLIYKRSTDGGKTWGALNILYSNSSKVDKQYTVIGNAAPVVLRDNGRILLPFCRNNLQVMLTSSDDDGLTWTAPINISGVVHPSWLWYAIHSIVTLVLKVHVIGYT